MGDLARVMTASYTRAVYEEDACRNWFRTTTQKAAGIFNAPEELIAFLIFDIKPEGLCYVKDFSTPPYYRTLTYTEEMTKATTQWVIGQGWQRLQFESCTEDYQVLQLYPKLGFEIIKHIPDRGNSEPGIVLEVNLGR